MNSREDHGDTCQVDSYNFIGKVSWESYNESVYFQDDIEAYRDRFGCYPESVHSDALFPNP